MTENRCVGRRYSKGDSKKVNYSKDKFERLLRNNNIYFKKHLDNMKTITI